MATRFQAQTGVRDGRAYAELLYGSGDKRRGTPGRKEQRKPMAMTLAEMRKWANQVDAWEEPRSDYAAQWPFEAGAAIVGPITGITVKTNTWGDTTVLEVEDQITGKPYSVYCGPANLKNWLAQDKPVVGSVVGIKCFGKIPLADGRECWSFRAEVLSGPLDQKLPLDASKPRHPKGSLNDSLDNDPFADE